MIRRFSVIAAVLMLSACSTVTDGATQEVAIETPGTSGAVCVLERPGHRMRVWAPKTVRITKSSGPMTVTCRAPGNREKTVVVDPEIADTFMLNIFNGFVPGALADNNTGAMYSYPDKIAVDFSGMPPERMEKPDYQRVLDENPDIFDMEEFRPGTPALQRDRNYVSPVLQPRRTDEELFSRSGVNAVRDGGESASVGKAGTPVSYEASTKTESSEPSAAAPQPVTSAPLPKTSAPAAGSSLSADQLTRRMNPAVFSATGVTGGTPVIGSGPAGSSAPTALQPGQ